MRVAEVSTAALTASPRHSERDKWITMEVLDKNNIGQYYVNPPAPYTGGPFWVFPLSLIRNVREV